MIQYNSKNAYLEIPKGLGNLGGNSGGGTDVTALSGSVVELQATVESEAARLNGLSAVTENIASQADYAISGVNALSGSVETLASEVDSQGDAIADLILDSDALDTRVSGNTADIAALSGQVETLSSSTVNGLETAQNAANSANTLASSAYTRADAAYTLAESLTGGTGGPTTYVLNLMTQQERAALYTELAAYRWVQKYAAVSSGFPVQDYAFYYFAGSETSDGWNDGARGFVPLQLAMIHPDDYGGALFFTGTVKSRQGNNEILWVRYIVTSTGEVDKSTGINNWYDPPGSAEIQINSDGSIRSEESWTLNNITDSSIAFRTWLAISDGTGNGRGQVLNWNSINEEVDTDVWTDVYYFSALIPVGTTTYKGQWRVYRTNDEWDSNHFAPISWTAQ